MDKKSLTETDIHNKFITPANLGEGGSKHTKDDWQGVVDHLLPENEKQLAQIAKTWKLLKSQLMEVLTR